MGVTPGSTSMARKGSPNAPGNSLTSARENDTTDGGSFSASTTSSMGLGFSGTGGGLGGAPDEDPAGGTVDRVVDAEGTGTGIGSGFGSVKLISNRILATPGTPSLVAGSNRHVSAAS